jgi:hypothetical protein
MIHAHLNSVAAYLIKLSLSSNWKQPVNKVTLTCPSTMTCNSTLQSSLRNVFVCVWEVIAETEHGHKQNSNLGRIPLPWQTLLDALCLVTTLEVANKTVRQDMQNLPLKSQYSVTCILQVFGTLNVCCEILVSVMNRFRLRRVSF